MVWWQYLLLVNIYLLLFYGFYNLLLRRETFFQLNRVYLVSAALLSFLIPLIQAEWVKNLFITQQVKYTIYGSPIVIYQLNPIVAKAPVSIGQLLAALYLAGVLFLTLRFLWQLIRLNKTINEPQADVAYSFFKKIRLNEQLSDSHVIATHEQVHAQQWHSADVLIIEAVMIINWFNPVVYFYRRAVKYIHEFIADSYTLKTGTNKADYALLLLTQTFNAPSSHLASHFFNHSLLKQRIMMLQKNRSQRIKLIKYGLSAPMFVLMLILSSATVNNSKAISRVNKIAIKVFDMPADTSLISKIKYVAITAKAVDTGLAVTARTHKVNSDITLAVIAQVREEKAKAVQTDTVPRSNELVFTAVEQEPQFDGSFGQFLAKNIQYPADAREQKIQGRVILTFVVEKDGELSNIKVLRSPDQSLGDEAARVIALSPKWVPGVQNGHAVRVQFTVPVSFTLADDNTASPDTGKLKLNLMPLKQGKVMLIVDGNEVNYDDLRLIDANNIQSLSVLKDKTAVALYGAKAANGVIIIKLKKLQTDKNQK